MGKVHGLTPNCQVGWLSRTGLTGTRVIFSEDCPVGTGSTLSTLPQYVMVRLLEAFEKYKAITFYISVPPHGVKTSGRFSALLKVLEIR